MKQNLIKYCITAIATFLLAVSSCFSWGEEISPWKTITLYKQIVHTGDYGEYQHYTNSIKYSDKDTALIYVTRSTESTGKELDYYYQGDKYIEQYYDIYPKLVYKLFLNTDSVTYDSVSFNPFYRKYRNFNTMLNFLLSEDGTYYYYSDEIHGNRQYSYVNIKRQEKYYLGDYYAKNTPAYFRKRRNVILKNNNFIACPDENRYFDPAGRTYFTYFSNHLHVFDSLGKQVIDYTRGNTNNELKPIYYMDQSPDGKYLAAFHCAYLDDEGDYPRAYNVGCHWRDYPNYNTIARLADFRIYMADGIGKNYQLYEFQFTGDYYNYPTCPTTKKIVQENIPFRFSQDSKKLYMQNLFGQPIGQAEHQEYYCFVSDLEKLTNPVDNSYTVSYVVTNVPTDTIYLGYPLRQAHWFNDDKNVLIIDDSTNKITVLETENYTKVNEITLKSSNGRLLKDFQVFPEGDLVVGFNDPLYPNIRGTIQLFKLSSISGVEDDKEITSVLYPNPTAQSAVLNLTLPTANEIDIIVSDLAGKQLQTQFCGLLPEGISQIEINTSALSSGSYFVTAKGKNFSKTFKLIVKR